MNHTIKVNKLSFHGGPHDGGVQFREEANMPHSMEFSYFADNLKPHPFLVHSYGRIGATSTYFYHGIRSMK